MKWWFLRIDELVRLGNNWAVEPSRQSQSKHKPSRVSLAFLGFGDSSNLTPEQREFVEFVLSRYVESGVEILDRGVLPELLKLKYEAIEDAIAILGSGDIIAQTFIDFQKLLYEAQAA